MTKQDFEMLAAAIKRTRALHKVPSLAETVNETLDALAADLAGELGARNPRFDTRRFLEACGATDL